MQAAQKTAFPRISAVFGLLTAALVMVNFANEEKRSRTTDARAIEFIQGKSSIQKNDGGPTWHLCSLTIRNRSARPFFLYGHGPTAPFIGMETKNPTSGKWEKRMLGYCGTGAGYHKVKPGASFTTSVSLPADLAGREFVVEVTRYPKKDHKAGVVERSPAFRLK
ncbi:MAG: hypothetical protein AAF514_16730 [Verrucomicrobiota bacterium]